VNASGEPRTGGGVLQRRVKQLADLEVKDVQRRPRLAGVQEQLDGFLGLRLARA
jgi:hypothetical protein